MRKLMLVFACLGTFALTPPAIAQATIGTSYLWMCSGVTRPTIVDTSRRYKPTVTATGALCWRQDTTAALLPPAPAPGTGEPVYVAGAGTLMLSDSMDRYSSVTSMAMTSLGFRPGQDPRNELQLTTGRGGIGTALRIAYQGGSQTGAEWHTVPGGLKGTDTSTHVIQYYARVTFSAPLQSTLGVKWLMGWHRSGADRIQWHMHWNPPQSGCQYSRSDVPPWTRWMVMDKSVSTNCQAMQPIGPFIEQVANGQWHRFTHEYRPNTRAGSRDGIARMWVDGVKILDVSFAACGSVPVVPLGAHLGKPYCALDDLDELAIADGIAFLKFGGAQTTSTPAWTMDVDDVVWWRR